MPSQRRVRAYGLVLVIVIIITIYMSSSERQTRTSDFYTKTQEALQHREFEKQSQQRSSENVGSRLKAAEDAAKQAADDKNQKYLDSVGGKEDKPVAGRVMMKDQNGDGKKVQGVATVGGKSRDGEGIKGESHTQEDHEVEVELNAILKKSPSTLCNFYYIDITNLFAVIIFSKSYCPYSMKAKNILLDKYKIVPAPYVVELDQHPLGQQLQSELGRSTGRRTVPNILIMGKSIGGGDDIQGLHQSDKLMNTLKSMGGSRITEVAYA
jgi:glutaredoxin